MGRKRILLALVGIACSISVLFINKVVLVHPKPAEQQAISYVGHEIKTISFVEHDSTYSTKIVIMGDTMLSRSVGSAVLSGGNPYQYVEDTIYPFDLRVANIETTIADTSVSRQASGKRFTFNAPLKTVETLANNNINVAVLANNHTSDYGSSATVDMITRLNVAGIHVSGAGKNIDQAFEPLILNLSSRSANTDDKLQSVKLAIISLNNIENNFTNATATDAGSAYFNKDRVYTSLQKARANADIVIVIPHWGVEYATSPTSDQVAWGHFFIDNGADMVIGGHPHVIQPTEKYKDKYIVYSMGNFIFDQMDGDSRDGQMVALTIEAKAKIDSSNNLVAATRVVSLSPPELIKTHIGSDSFPRLSK